MLGFIVEHSLRFRNIVLVLAALAMVYGVRTTMHAKLDVFPDFVQPQATIQTEAPGLSPEQVEALVTRPIESAVGGVMNIESLRSQSIQGLSIITVVFTDQTDVFVARQMLADDPQLRAEFEQRLATDEAFRTDRAARLEFFYRRSPFWDPRLNHDPIVRVETPAALAGLELN